MKKNISLPALRRVCGFTQAGLAKKIGVAPRTIVAAENGTRSLTEANARKIMFVTGVLPQSLLQDDSPRALDGKSYTRDHWALWRRPPGASDSEESFWTIFLEESLLLKFASLVEAAAGSSRTFLVAEEFSMMLTRLFHDPVIKRRYLESVGEAGSPESFESWIDGIQLLVASDLGAKGGDPKQSQGPFGLIPGLDD